MRLDTQHGDCLEILPALQADSFDACVTDPPYHLSSIVKRFGAEGAAPARSDGATGVYQRSSVGFMGQMWDGGDVAFRPETWAKVMSVLKPGAHLVAFGAPKNVHRLTCAIEDAGFEIRDQLMWIFGSGFPKSHDTSKAAGAAWAGWGTALKPAYEPIILARKPLIGTVAENVLRYGTGALNIDATRIQTCDDLNGGAYAEVGGRDQSPSMGGTGMNRPGATTGRSFMPPPGRWPANVAHDGSDEVEAYFPDAPGALADVTGEEPASSTLDIYGAYERSPMAARGDTGSASRFFYCAKATKAERAGSKHPTVKPIALMRWLCRMVTPPGGTILDPFAGTGTTGEAAYLERFNAVLIERDAKYFADLKRRMDHINGPLFAERAFE